MGVVTMSDYVKWYSVLVELDTSSFCNSREPVESASGFVKCLTDGGVE